MSGPSDFDLNALAMAVHEALRCNCDSGMRDEIVAEEMWPAVEAIVQRAVNEALTEAADELESRMARGVGGHPYSDRDRGLREAARIVRARRT